MACKDCEYMNMDDRWSYKCLCEYYNNYYDPDDSSCSHFKSRGSSGPCFLTTACVEYKGLADDCYELETMRWLRDNIIKELDHGENMIRFYYDEAPRIIEQIDASDSKDEIYEYIYMTIKDEIIPFVENEKYEQAIIQYWYMMYQADLKSIRER